MVLCKLGKRYQIQQENTFTVVIFILVSFGTYIGRSFAISQRFRMQSTWNVCPHPNDKLVWLKIDSRQILHIFYFLFLYSMMCSLKYANGTAQY